MCRNGLLTGDSISAAEARQFFYNKRERFSFVGSLSLTISAVQPVKSFDTILLDRKDYSELEFTAYRDGTSGYFFINSFSLAQNSSAISQA